MVKVFYLLVILFFAIGHVHGQFVEDFSDLDLSNNPSWEGDLANFKVNTAEELQLDAPEAGTSFLYTATDFPDSIRWTMEFLMDFSPSNSNKLNIYLAVDDINFTSANGYLLKIGENGSDDALNFYALENGNETMLASGSLGALGSDPAFAQLTIEKTADHFWSFYVSYEDGQTQQLDFEYSDMQSVIPSSGFFALECIYTVSRVEDFYFDDISVQPLLPDSEPPSLISTDILSAEKIELVFSEPIDPSSAQSTNNYMINGLGSPASVEFDPANPSVVILCYSNGGLQSGQEYELSINNLTDLNANAYSESGIFLVLIEEALPGDLLINEILFDPYSEGSDFVEIYNNSDKFIRLEGLILSNDSKDNDKEELNTNLILAKGEYIAISPDIAFLEEEYKPVIDANLLRHDIPSFNNADGNVSIERIIDGLPVSIDSFDYREDMHYVLIDDTEGVSLERLSFQLDSNDEENWQSSTEPVNYATPGYANAQMIGAIEPGPEAFTLGTQMFSPNGDGDNDRLILQYALEKDGYVANIQIFNSNGFPVRSLVENQLLATNGIISWDGLNNDGDISSIGMYIVLYELFHPDGDVKQSKLVCVLADFL